MHPMTSGASDQNMSRPSCGSRGLAGFGAGPGAGPTTGTSGAFGCGSSVTPQVSQPRRAGIPAGRSWGTNPPQLPELLLGESATMTAQGEGSLGPGSSTAVAGREPTRRREAPDRNLAL